MDYIIITYFVMLVVFFVYFWWSYSRDRNSYMKVACKRLKTTIQCMDGDLTKLDEEIEKLYIGYANNIPSVKKVYPNVVVWLEDIVYRINADFKYASGLRENAKEIKSARDRLCEKYPFYECERYQQEILESLKKLNNSKDRPNESIIIENLITRIREEFAKLNKETKKDRRFNSVAIFFTVVSIIVTIGSFLK